MSPENETQSAPAVPLDGGWVTARPARGSEVLARLVRLPELVREYRDLVATTLKRDLSARFQGTLLGWAWPLLQPLILFGVYYFIFTELLQFRMPGLPPEQRAAMGVYMFCGMLAWTAVGESLSRGTAVIVDNGNLIKKLAFPSELLPLNVVLAALVMALFSAAMFVVAAVVTPVWPAPGLHLLWIPAIVLVQIVFSYGLVLLFSTLQVFLRDTAQIVAMATTVWMFLTPIFWVPEVMGESVERWLPFIRANPTYHMVAAWRGALMGDVSFAMGDTVLHPVTIAAIPGHLAVFALWALGLYAVGFTFFVLSQRRFADEV
jgi:ABC-type polysaccharide/polyol phosphate export permease